MINKQTITNLLSKMTENNKNNTKLIEKFFGTLNYRDSDNQTILHILVDNKYDESKCLLAIRSLLSNGLNPNALADFNYNFIQTALYAGYSENFILSIINESLKYGLDINHTDDDQDTIMHTAIYSDDYKGNYRQIFLLLVNNRFDTTKVDHDNRNVFEAMLYMKTTNQKTFSKFEIDLIRNLTPDNSNISNLSSNQSKPTESTTQNLTSNNQEKQPSIQPKTTNQPKNSPKETIKISSDIIKELEKYGNILNLKSYLSSPTIGRDEELKNLIITLAADKKSPILVGESGVGKSALVDELAYRIQTGNVPKFLTNQIILEVTPSELVAGDGIVSKFEKKITNLLSLCQKYQIILFIDEIHTIYGTGSYKNNDNDLSDMLKHYLDRSNLKIIGTTTDEEYTKYFAYDALKRRFEKIFITEPTDKVLEEIINKVIDDYSSKSNLYLKDEPLKDVIVSVITIATAKNHRIYNDNVNNPDLAISIIDKAFAYAKYYDSEIITLDHFIDSFNSCCRLSGPAKEQAIAALKEANKQKNKPFTRILEFEKPKH